MSIPFCLRPLLPGSALSWASSAMYLGRVFALSMTGLPSPNSQRYSLTDRSTGPGVAGTTSAMLFVSVRGTLSRPDAGSPGWRK